MLRKTNFADVPMKPQRVYQCMNNNFERDTCYVSTIGLSQIAAAQFLHVYNPRHWINCGRPARWAGPSPPRSACVPPIRRAGSSRSRATTTSSS